MEGKAVVGTGDSVPSSPKKPLLRPRDAGTLILLDRSGGDVRVLMGKRHMRHVFMPGMFVFPGGRTDPADSRVSVAEGLSPLEQHKLARIGGTRTSFSRARAIALSAVRETYEEAGILIGREGKLDRPGEGWLGFAERGLLPSLADLRFIARAITPPGRVRRFDTRFLACWRDRVALELPDGGPSDELGELVWLTIEEAKAAGIPYITQVVLGVLEKRLRIDPDLAPGGPVPFFREIRSKQVRETL